QAAGQHKLEAAAEPRARAQDLAAAVLLDQTGAVDAHPIAVEVELQERRVAADVERVHAVTRNVMCATPQLRLSTTKPMRENTCSMWMLSSSTSPSRETMPLRRAHGTSCVRSCVAMPRPCCASRVANATSARRGAPGASGIRK